MAWRKLSSWLVALALALAIWTFLPGVASADEAHTGVPFVSGAALWVGAVLVGAALLAGVFAFRRARRPAAPRAGEMGWLYMLTHFSRNAKLFLVYALFAELGAGIWRVMFNLYLLALGFNLEYIGLVLGLNFLFHGLFAFPAGLIADKYGRRFTFALAVVLAVVSRGGLLFTLDPLAIMALMAMAGAAEGFHAVAGGPFIMENCRPQERSHLFSLNSAFLQLSLFAGALSAGFLTVLYGNFLSVIPADPLASRMALVTSLPLTILALPPLLLITERRLPADRIETFRELFTLRNIQSHGTIAKLFVASLVVGLGFGFITPFLNVFFREAHQASYESIGTIFSVGHLTAVLGTLLSPLIIARWGRTRGITASLILSVPFLLLMAPIPYLPLVATFYVLRGGVWSLSMPLRSQLAMELVVTRERGTTNGLVHAAFDVPIAPAAAVAGVILATGNYIAAFSLAGAIFAAAGLLYYAFFAATERSVLAPAMAPMPASHPGPRPT